MCVAGVLLSITTAVVLLRVHCTMQLAQMIKLVHSFQVMFHS
jgi:hypothetical protein